MIEVELGDEVVFGGDFDKWLQDPVRFLYYLHQVDITQYGASGLSTHLYPICNYRMKHCTRRDFGNWHQSQEHEPNCSI